MPQIRTGHDGTRVSQPLGYTSGKGGVGRDLGAPALACGQMLSFPRPPAMPARDGAGRRCRRNAPKRHVLGCKDFCLYIHTNALFVHFVCNNVVRQCVPECVVHPHERVINVTASCCCTTVCSGMCSTSTRTRYQCSCNNFPAYDIYSRTRGMHAKKRAWNHDERKFAD